MINRLESLGVSVNPVIDFESWDDPVYANVFDRLKLSDRQCICVRLSMNVDTISELLMDPDYIKTQIESILSKINVNQNQTELLIDFSDISAESKTITDLVDQATKVMSLLKQCKFNKIMMAGCSLPPFISSVIKSHNEVGKVLRKEMVAWQAILQSTTSFNLGFADYCVRGPSSTEIGFGNTNGKVRYTIDKNYFIARGYPLNTGLKGAQYFELCEKVIGSGYYMDRDFSWGDDRLYRCSEEEFRGRGCDWVAIDTNHHIKTVLVEIYEFDQKLIVQKKIRGRVSENI
jgi:T4 beta protein